MTVNDDRRARAAELHAQRWSTREIAASPDVEGGDRATLYGSPAAVSKALAAHRTASGRGRLLEERDRDVATLDELIRSNVPAAAEGDRDATRNVAALIEQRARLCGYRASDDPARLVERHDAAIAEQVRADALAALDVLELTDEQRETYRATLDRAIARRAAVAGAPRTTTPAAATGTDGPPDELATRRTARDRLAALS